MNKSDSEIIKNYLASGQKRWPEIKRYLDRNSSTLEKFSKFASKIFQPADIILTLMYLDEIKDKFSDADVANNLPGIKENLTNLLLDSKSPIPTYAALTLLEFDSKMEADLLRNLTIVREVEWDNRGIVIAHAFIDGLIEASDVEKFSRDVDNLDVSAYFELLMNPNAEDIIEFYKDLLSDKFNEKANRMLREERIINSLWNELVLLDDANKDDVTKLYQHLSETYPTISVPKGLSEAPIL